VKLPAPRLAHDHTIHRVVQVDPRRIIVLSVLLGLAFSALLAIPFVFYQRAETGNSLSLMQAEQERVIKLAASAIHQETDAVLSDLRYLSQHNAIRNHLARDSRSSRIDLAMEYVGLARQKRLYDQVRFIGLDGREVVRVDFNNGHPETVVDPGLEDRHDRAYFEETLWLSPGQIYVSPLDVNPEPGAALGPVIRFATPVADEQGLIRGMVVLDYLGQRLRDKLVTLGGQAGRVQLFDAQGHWLMGAGPDADSGLTDRRRSQPGLAEWSARLWRQMEGEQSGVRQTDASLLRFERVYPLLGENLTPAQAGYASPVDADRYFWTVVVEYSQSAMQAANRALLKNLATVYATLVLFAFLVAGALALTISRNKALAQVMEKVVDNVPVLIAYVDAEQRYRFNNMAYERAFGLRPTQIYGKSMRELLGEDAYRAARPYIEQALAGNAVSFERQMAFAGSGMRDVAISYLPDPSPQGGVHGFYVMVNDVSPIKASQRRERQHMLELAHVTRLASLGEMATEIAHEINQPLAAIAMYSAAGLRTMAGECDRNKMETWLEAINTQAKRASEIVKRVRSFVQKGEPRLAPVDLNLVARETDALVDHDARSHDVEIVLELAEDLPLVQGERVLLEQVVFNLLRNAIDAVAGSGERRVTLRTFSDAQLVYVEVSDTGPGVDPALGEQIFSSFVTSKQGGLGMGLAISRSIVEAHGGSLRYASNPGGGATFTFSLAQVPS
jgi:PAS domain S-box-containing protein